MDLPVSIKGVLIIDNKALLLKNERSGIGFTRW